jgi:enoyl-CoA hydratase/carnithine racemase
MYQHIIIEQQSGIGKIIFNNPEHFNPLVPDMMKEIMSAQKEMEENNAIRVIIFTGSGKGFSAGADYDFMKTLTKMSASEIKENVYKYFIGGVKSVKLCSKPTIASVRGPAVGGGCDLAIACDFRIASETALFKEAWVKLGLMSPLGGMFLLPRLIGLSKATEMFMLGRPVNGKEAETIGLVNTCVPDDKLEEETDVWAKKLVKGAPLALAAIKEGLRRGMESTLFAEWEVNAYAQATLLSSNDFKEAVSAIKTSRDPFFKGE